MTFFNKREEVLDIQLTQYGKSLLSKGKFKPVYYAFFDDDIVYDLEYTGVSEDPSLIKNRIKDSIRPKTQYVFRSLEEEFKYKAFENDEEMQAFLKGPMQQEKDRYYSEILPIGSSQLGTQDAPKININFMSGRLSGSVTELSGDVYFPSNVEIQTEMLYKKKFILFDDYDNLSFNNDEEIILANISQLNGDSVTAMIERDDLLISVEEENTGIKFLDNFDIEVFKLDEDKEEWTQLFFREESTSGLVKNNILIDKPEIEEVFYNYDYDFPTEDDPRYVSYYFDLAVDRDIDRRYLCRHIHDNRIVDIFTDIRIDCTEAPITPDIPNIYRPEDYEDPCDD